MTRSRRQTQNAQSSTTYSCSALGCGLRESAAGSDLQRFAVWILLVASVLSCYDGVCCCPGLQASSAAEVGKRPP